MISLALGVVPALAGISTLMLLMPMQVLPGAGTGVRGHREGGMEGGREWDRRHGTVEGREAQHDKWTEIKGYDPIPGPGAFAQQATGVQATVGLG